MKRICAFIIALILFLSLLPYGAAASASEASDFVAGEYSKLSMEANEVVEGEWSLVGRYQGEKENNSILFTNPATLPLVPNKTYTLTFKYKILEAPDKGFAVVFYSTKGGDAGEWITEGAYTGKAGDQGEITMTRTLKAYDDYQIFWSICGKGAVAIDSIKLTEEGVEAPIAMTGFELDSKYNFPRKRTDYRLDLESNGIAVVDRESGKTIIVPFGEKMTFDGEIKYSKNTSYIIHNVRSHAETFISMEESAALPVDYLRTTAYWIWDGKTARECMEERFDSPWRFPDRPDKVIAGYINMTETGSLGGGDASFDPSWDLDGDSLIDKDSGPLPDYIDPKVYNAAWKNYVAKFWTDSWIEEIKKKIDMTAAQHFDGIYLDVMSSYWAWRDIYPSMEQEIVKGNQRLLEAISSYAHEQYGSAFMVTGNHGGVNYFSNFGSLVDGALMENGFFRWDGSGVVDGHARSISEKSFKNPVIDYYRSEGLCLLSMEHLGTGPHDEDLDFKDYNSQMSGANYLLVFRWAIDSGTIPYVVPTLVGTPYAKIRGYESLPAPEFMEKPDSIPRFTRIYAGMPPSTDTQYGDWVIGSEADDVIPTGSGKDMIYGGPGDDKIYGGPDGDGAYYTGKRAYYDVVTKNGVTTVTGKKGNEGSDLLIGVEYLIFADATEKLPAYDASFSDIPAKGISAEPGSTMTRTEMAQILYNLLSR
ncbi:MAG TPA: hypothetical protein PLG67_02870 [Bacillota bacterium]|nr:hypothetical protein [Spirochaetales bacterium]HQL35518.1 hypothetical protein [Bacillota bacterium]